jgi:hypothetical protein
MSLKFLDPLTFREFSYIDYHRLDALCVEYEKSVVHRSIVVDEHAWRQRKQANLQQSVAPRFAILSFEQIVVATDQSSMIDDALLRQLLVFFNDECVRINDWFLKEEADVLNRYEKLRFAAHEVRCCFCAIRRRNEPNR